MRRAIGLCCLLAALGLSGATHAGGPPAIANLWPGTVVDRQFGGGEPHRYRVSVAAGSYLDITVRYLGVEVIWDLFAADGEKIAMSGDRHQNAGEARVFLSGEAAGVYRLELRTLPGAKIGTYRVTASAARPPGPRDRLRAEAQRLHGSAYRHAEDADTRPRALELVDEALAQWRAAGDREGEADSERLRALVFLGLNDRPGAEAALGHARDLARVTGDRFSEAQILNDLGEMHHEAGDPHLAHAAYTEALAIRQAIGHRLDEALVLNNLGVLYRQTGELQKALEHGRLVGEHWRGSHGEPWALNNLGLLHLQLGEPALALRNFERARSLWREAADRGGEARALGGIGAVHSALGDWPAAVEYRRRAVGLFRAIKWPSGLGRQLLGLGEAYSAAGDHARATQSLTEALDIARALRERAVEAQVLRGMADADRSMGHRDRAEALYRQALSLSRAVGDQNGEATAAVGLALIAADEGRLDEARGHIESALTLDESLRTTIVSHDLRASYLATKQDHYGLYVDILMALHERRPADGYAGAALQANERRRARGLLDALAEEASAIRGGADPALLERERELRQRVSAKADRFTRLLDGGRGAAAHATERELDTLLADYQRIDERIRADNPNYASLTRPEPVTLRDLQAQLDEGTLLLEYALGPSRSYLWAVTRTQMTSHVLPAAATIETAARRAHELLGKSHEFELGVQARWAAVRLSDLVLAPVARHLGAKRFVIVADGALQYVPFGALPAPGAPARPLILDREIVSLPSASVLPRLRRLARDRPVADRALAIFADPVLTIDDPRVASAARLARGDAARSVTPLHLKRLPFSREEADSIASLAGAEGAFSATDFDASRTAATGTAIARYRRLHFATHAVIDTHAPRLSGIVLSQFTREGSPQDGFLRLHDIYNLRLGADLVTLSACETALGKEVRGEGLIGLTRGFMYAGSPRVVASVWRVRDRATSELMRRFYDGMLSRRLAPAAALRAAQVSMLKEPQWAAPHYWAGFVLHGEWR